MICKVLRTEVIKQEHKEDVYDISVEDNHNFILENGSIVHNCDTYQSADLQQILKAEGFPIETLSVDRVGTNQICIPYQSFKSAIYEKRIEFFEDELLIEEVTNLERNNDTGKIDHPDGGSKDKSDAVCGAVYTASQYAEEFAYRYGESEALKLTVELNSSDYSSSDHEQITLAWEEELKRINGTFSSMKSQDTINANNSFDPTENYSLWNDDIIM